MELHPLSVSARVIIKQLRYLGIEVRIVMAELDKRFFVYILGRGIPPPNNMTFRWCTRQIKIDPMQVEIAKLYKLYKKKLLCLTGVRRGESAIRDARIKMSCGKDDTECGQGWYQQMKNDDIADKLAPILHWRVCGIWDWLKLFAPMERYGEWKTELLADAYGGEEAEEINARTGCVGCPLASKDTAIIGLLNIDPIKYNYLSPLLRLRNVYEELRRPYNRLRKHGEKNKDGSASKNPNRMGPLTMKARRWALYRILKIQKESSDLAAKQGLPKIDILNIHEVIRINELISKNTWPDKWDGTESTADKPFLQIYKDGSYQLSLIDEYDLR